MFGNYSGQFSNSFPLSSEAPLSLGNDNDAPEYQEIFTKNIEF